MGPHEPRLSMGTAESRRSSFQERADEVSEEEYIAKTREALAQAEVSGETKRITRNDAQLVKVCDDVL